MTPRPTTPALVVGLGSVDRGDDAVGPAVAAQVGVAVAALRIPGVEVVEHEDPTALIALMDGHDLVVVVDAVRSGAPAGTVTVREVGHRGRPLGARPAPGPAGTHGLGLAMAVELARTLGRLPQRVLVVGVEAVGFEHGHPMSAPVLAAVPLAVGVVLEVLEGASRSTAARQGGGGVDVP